LSEECLDGFRVVEVPEPAIMMMMALADLSDL